MAELEFRKALWQALDEELARDENVIFFGEDVAKAGGVFQVTPGLRDRHGEDRVFDTPISELALSTAAFGSAVCGLRPVFEIMFADFFALAMDSLVNQAAKYWYLSNGQAPVPLVVRSAVGGGGRFGAIHSQVPAPWFQAIPGLKIVAPATPAHAKGLLKASIRDNNPVLFFEHKRLYSLSAEVDGSEPELIPLGSAETVRAGGDLTIATAMKGVHDSLAAATELAALGIDCEVIDLRTLRPLDIDAVAASVEKTGRLLVVEEGPRTGGWAGEVVASISERCLGRLDDCWRLATDDLPLPYSPPLEDAFLPGTEAIVRAVRERGGVMPEGAA
jgi:pyruvate/2-oxoglutarate/acetoin dehydrogenase E1 component